MGRIRTVAGLLLVVAGVTAVAGGLGYLAVTIDDRSARQEFGNATAVPGAVEQLHEAGITGEDVSVGILDVTGFESDPEGLARRVVETRQFDTGTPAAGGRNDHGTATAVTIARMAPDADLYLGTFGTVDQYSTALAWMVEQGVDVVVVPVAYAGTFGDGRSRIARATSNATDRGVAVVAPAGNLGTSHWLGEYTPTENGIHVFENDTLNEISGPAGRAEFWLTTEDSTGEYRLELHELGDGTETELLARSVPHEAGTVPSERLTVRLDDGRYALVVRGPETDTDTRIRVASSTHSLSRTRAGRSVTAPAVAPGAISVGAFDPETNRTEPYSSRGPTLDGRLGVHVVAPSRLAVPGVGSFTGTSAAATYVGGIATLVLDGNHELEPAEVRGILTETAEPIGGVDARSGHGRVAPGRAVDEAIDRSEERRVRPWPR